MNQYNNIDNYSGLSDLQQLTTVRCCICINPGDALGATTAASFTYTFPDPATTSSIYSRHLRATYRNSRPIRDFCTFLRDHDTYPSPSTASDTPGDSLPEGPPVTWIQCDREEDVAPAVRQAVEKMK